MTTEQQTRRVSLKRLSTGIYKDAYSIRAIVNIAAGRKEKRFDFDHPLKDIKRWRNETKTKLERLHPQRRAGAIGRGTFTADLKRYIKTLAIASWKSTQSCLRAWAAEFGTKKRRRVVEQDLKKAIKKWTDAGVPPKTILNRVRAFTAMYHALDGKDAWTPADNLELTKARRRIPDYVAPETIIAIEQTLRAQEEAGALEPEWRARFMVLTACGARPVHLRLAKPEHVDLERRVWNVVGAKGGEAIPFPLNRDQVAAWTRFLEVNVWGEWDQTKYPKIVRAAGWPAAVRPYNAKHAFGQDLADRGIDRETIADLYGHTDTQTTRIYVPRSKLARASQAIDGRLGWGKPAAADVGSENGAPSKEQIAQALEVLRRANAIPS